jgi:hypothetical protein
MTPKTVATGSPTLATSSPIIGPLPSSSAHTRSIAPAAPRPPKASAPNAPRTIPTIRPERAWSYSLIGRPRAGFGPGCGAPREGLHASATLSHARRSFYSHSSATTPTPLPLET